MKISHAINRIIVTCFLLWSIPAFSATLLPPGEIQFSDANGKPFAGGKIYMYVPNTTIFKSTWKDANQTILNTNPIVLDAAGRAIIYGTGTYTQLLKDVLGNTIYSQLTTDTSGTQASVGGTSTGTPNAQVVSASNFSSVDGQTISFVAGFTNTGATTLNPGTGVISVLKDTAAGPVGLTGGEIVAGNVVQVIYSSATGTFHLVSYPQGTTFASITTGTLTVTGASTFGSGVQAAAAFVPGEVRYFSQASCPTGWLLPNGGAISRTVYAALFANIGTVYGAGDGTTTFNVPNYQGYFLRVWSNGSGIDPGRAFASIQTDALQGHTHAYTNSVNNGTNGAGGTGMKFSDNAAVTGGPISDGTNGTPRIASETRPINVSILACVKS